MSHDIDPVCGKRMNANKAHIVVNYQGQDYYLCVRCAKKNLSVIPANM